MQAMPCILAAALLTATCLQAEESASPKPGAVVFQTDFDTPTEQQAWPKADFATWVTGYQETTSLRISAPVDQAAGGHMIHMPLDLAPYRGCRLLFECMAKADNVSKPPAPYLGAKFMLHYASEAEGPLWHNEQNVHGTFDWRKLQFAQRIAPDADHGQISLGLQDSSGTAWFDAVKVTVLSRPVTRPTPPTNPPPAFRGHGLPRLRGVMSPNTFRDEDLRVLGLEWKANVIRWQLTRNWGQAGTERDLAEYDQWLDGKLDELDQALDACLRYGIKVVVDMHSPPGGRYENMDLAIFHEPEYQDHYVALWEKIARRYHGNPAVWGFDLVNEPVQNVPSPEGVADYLGTQVRAAKAIRAIDADVPIFIESAQWDSAAGYEELEPVDVSNVIYQVHMYVPGEFTHQGVHGEWKATTYPGEINGKKWDKGALRQVLKPVREFQLAYNVHIYVGEFSAIRWAPGAAQYLGDCIDLFEEYGWDWTYHAYREWDGWSVEHGADPDNHEPTTEPTDRKKLLLTWFGKNTPPEEEREEGFVALFNGADLSGWTGDLRGYAVEDGLLVAKNPLGNIYTESEYADFVLRFEFKLTPGANNGIGIRVPLQGKASHDGLEIQILDDTAEKFADLKPYQYHGSIYGIVPAKQGYQEPVGEWNAQEIRVEGTKVKVTLNGVVIVDADLKSYRDGAATPDGKEHPGLAREAGHISLAGHKSALSFRNLRIKAL